MSTSPDHSTPQTEWDRAEGARFRSTAATTGLVALITLRELARRRGALALATMLPADLLPGAPGDALDRHPAPVDRPGLGDGNACAVHAGLVPLSGPPPRCERGSARKPTAGPLPRGARARVDHWPALHRARAGHDRRRAHPPERRAGHAAADRHRRHSPRLPGRRPGSTGPGGGLFCCCRSWRCRYWWILPRAGPASYRCGRPENWRASSWRTWGRIPAPTCTAGWRMAQPWPPC